MSVRPMALLPGEEKLPSKQAERLQLSLSHRVGAHLPGAVGTEQAKSMVNALALERAATPKAGPHRGLRLLFVHLAPEPVANNSLC
jgi:hypothetical protein